MYMEHCRKHGWILKGMIASLSLFVAAVPVTGQLDLPDKPDLIMVDVDHSDNGVWILWEASTDTTVDLYHIYRMENGTGTKLFSFQPQTLEYKHMTSGLVNLAYTVTAEDTTGGITRESLLEDNEHRAVAIDLEFNPCDSSVTVNWTGYVGWEGKVSGYRICGAVAGNTPEPIDFTGPNARSYVHRGVEINAEYIYYIETQNLSGMVSHSPIDTIYTEYPDAPGFLTVDYVSVTDPSTVEIQFTADVEGAVNSFRLMKRPFGNPAFEEVETFWNTDQATHNILDHFSVLNKSYEYKVQALYLPETCTDPIVISESNPGTSIYLAGTLENRTVRLVWTEYEAFPGDLKEYVIQKRDAGGDFVPYHTVGPDTETWSDSVVSVINGHQPVGELQYKVQAVENQSGNGTPNISESNIVSVYVESSLLLPNAITPSSDDINSVFKPRMDFAPKNYTMIIYDRVGRKLFETGDPGEGWNGTFRGGEPVMEGVYIYFIQYTDYTGLFRTMSGNVTVLYPKMF